jgi:hypothetical protein
LHVGLRHDRAAKRCQGETGELKGLDTEWDPDDRDAQDDASNEVSEGQDEARKDPEDIAYQAGTRRIGAPYGYTTEGPEAEAGKLEALHREGNRDDWEAEQET